MICQILRVRLLGDPTNKLVNNFCGSATTQSRMILGIQVGVSCLCNRQRVHCRTFSGSYWETPNCPPYGSIESIHMIYIIKLMKCETIERSWRAFKLVLEPRSDIETHSNETREK